MKKLIIISIFVSPHLLTAQAADTFLLVSLTKFGNQHGEECSTFIIKNIKNKVNLQPLAENALPKHVISCCEYNIDHSMKNKEQINALYNSYDSLYNITYSYLGLSCQTYWDSVITPKKLQTINKNYLISYRKVVANLCKCPEQVLSASYVVKNIVIELYPIKDEIKWLLNISKKVVNEYNKIK